MSVACVVKRHFSLAPPMWWLKCHMMSQFIYLEVITARRHVSYLFASWSARCLQQRTLFRHAMRQDGMWQQGRKKADQLLESPRFRRVADRRVSALLCAAEEAQPSWKTGCTCCSQTLNALLMPSFGLYACTYQGIALSISPSGLRGFAPTQSLYAHMHMQRRNSGECRLTVLGTYACMFVFFTALSPSLHSFLSFQSTEMVKSSSFPMGIK